MPRRLAGLGLRLAVTIGLLGVLLLVVADPAAVARNLRDATPGAVLAAIGLCALDRVTMAYKWWLLLRARRMSVTFGTAVRAYFASSLYGLILPVTVGADAVRIVALRHAGVPDVTASIVVERAIGFVATASVALVSSLLLASAVAGFADQALIRVLVGAIGGGVALFVVSLVAAGRAAKWRRTPGVIRRIAESYSLYRRHPGVLALFYLLSVFESLLFAGTVWILAAGMRVPFPLLAAVATVPLSLAVARLPVSLGGFGVQEAAFVYLAGLVGVPADEAFSVFLLAGGTMLATLLPSALDTRMFTLRRQAARGGVV